MTDYLIATESAWGGDAMLLTQPSTVLSDEVLQRAYDLRMDGYSCDLVIMQEGLRMSRYRLRRILTAYAQHHGLPFAFPKSRIYAMEQPDPQAYMPGRDGDEDTQTYHKRLTAAGFFFCHFCERLTQSGALFCQSGCHAEVVRLALAGYLNEGICECSEVMAFLEEPEKWERL